jgi:hypothetical protein
LGLGRINVFRSLSLFHSFDLFGDNQMGSLEGLIYRLGALLDGEFLKFMLMGSSSWVDF